MATLEEMQAQLAELEGLQSQLSDLQAQGVNDSHFDKTMDSLNPQDSSHGPIGAPTEEQVAQNAVSILGSPEGAGSPERQASLMGQYKAYADPIDKQAGIDKLKMVGTAGLKLGGGLAATALVPEAAVPAGIAEAAPLVTRGAGYAMNAISGALGSEAGDQVAQQTGIAPKKSFDQTVDSIATNTAVGGALPLAADAGATALKSAASWFSKTLLNTAGRVGGFLGAGKIQGNPEAENYTTDKVNLLMSNSPFFNEQIVKRSDPVKQYDAAKSYLEQTGKAIGDFYDTHAPIPVPTDYIFQHPNIVKLQNVIADPTSNPKMIEEAQAALDGLNFFMGKKAVRLEDAWKVRQNLDNSIQGAIYNKGVGQTPQLAQNIQDTADAVRQAMEVGIKGGVNTGTITADAADKLLKAKMEFSNLTPIKKLLGGEYSTANKTTLIDRLPTSLPQMGAAALTVLKPYVGLPVAGAMALKSNAGRAFGARLPDYLQGVSDIASVASPYLGAGSSLFQRTTDSTKIDIPSLAQTVFQKAVSLYPPDTAMAFADEVQSTMTGGNEMAKRQMIGVLGQQFPEIFEPHKDGLMSVVDNRIQDPMEKDIHLQSASELENPVDRARVIGAVYNQGKYEPLDNTPPAPMTPQKPNNVDLDMVMNSFGSYEMPGESLSSSPEQTSMIDDLYKKTSIHAQDFP